MKPASEFDSIEDLIAARIEEAIAGLVKRVSELERRREQQAQAEERSSARARDLMQTIRKRRKRDLASYARSAPAPKAESIN